MMFSVPGPENDDRRDRELAVSAHDGIRLVSVRHDPLARVTTYVWAIDDGPPGAEVDCQDEEVHVPIASLDCTAMVTYDERQGWTWLDTDGAHHRGPERGELRGTTGFEGPSSFFGGRLLTLPRQTGSVRRVRLRRMILPPGRRRISGLPREVEICGHAGGK